MLIYGFSDFHEDRNVGSFRRLASRALYSHIDLRVPYVLLGPDGRLKGYPPEQYADHADWPLKEYSVVITSLEELYMLVKLWYRVAQKTVVTQMLLSEMDELAAKHRAKLLVVILSSDPAKKADYIEFFQKQGIWFVDCTHPKYDSPEMVVEGEGHPNAAMNEYWASCIEAAIRPELSKLR